MFLSIKVKKKSNTVTSQEVVILKYLVKYLLLRAIINFHLKNERSF